MVFLVYRIETFSFSEGFPGRFLSSALKSNHNSLNKGLYTVSVRLILPIWERVAIQMTLEYSFYIGPTCPIFLTIQLDSKESPQTLWGRRHY